MSATNVPLIPSVTPDNLTQVARAIKGILDVREGLAGDQLDQYITFRDLVDVGLAKLPTGGKTGGGYPVITTGANTDGYDPGADLSTPPKPTGLSASGAISIILLQWDSLPFGYRNHAYTEVWRSSTNVIGNAVLIGTSDSRFYSDAVGSAQTYYYWVRFVSQSNIKGPYNATSGVQGQTGQDPAYLLSVLSGSITSDQLHGSLSSRINLIDAPSTTVGSVNARIAVVQGQVNNLLSIPAWSSTTAYTTGSQVTYSGGLYSALQASTNVVPTNATYWQKIGDYTSLGDAVAAHTTQITDLQSGLGQEVIDRNALAVQMRGNYAGNDLSLVSQGLIYTERTARANAVSAVATSVTNLTAMVNTKTRSFYQSTAPTGTTDNPLVVGDVWVDTSITYAKDYFQSDYSIKSNRMYRWDGTQWAEAMDYGFADTFSAINLEQIARVNADSAMASQINTLISSVNSNAAAITTESITRASADTSLANQITTLSATVNTNNSTLTAAVQSEATARANADTSLAQTISTVSATANGKNKSYAQSSAPAPSTGNPLVSGDLWIDTSNNNTLYRYINGNWVAVSDSSALQSWINSTYLPSVADIQSQVDQKIETWFQSTDPSSSWTTTALKDLHVGDLWYNTDSKVFNRYLKQSGSYVWSPIQDATAISAAAAAAAAQGTADSKVSTYATSSAPSSNLVIGDLWIDSSNGNKLYRWNGSQWINSQDAGISAASSRITTIETSKIGYATLDATNEAFDNNGAIVTKDDVTAWNIAHPSNTATWHVGIPMATAVKQVSVSDGVATAALEQRFTAQRTLNGQLSAQYYIKTDVAGHVAGFGLYNDTTSGSRFGIQADRFYVAPGVDFSQEAQPSGSAGQIWYKPSVGITYRFDGSNWVVFSTPVPFVVQAVDTTINGVAVPAGVYIGDAFIKNGTITNAKIGFAEIDDSKIAAITAEKIKSGFIDSDRIKAGTVTADKIGAGQISSSGNITVGGTGDSAPLVLTPNGEVISNGTLGDKARLYSGNVEIYKNVPDVGSVVYKALSRAEFGQATNNTTVTIPGYFKTQPKIIVSPADLQLYSQAYSGQNQSIQCQAQNIAETSAGSMSWQFKPVATLSLAANTGSAVINQVSGSQTSSWTSSQYTTPANTSTITPTVYLASNRGNGSNQYYYRTVRWRVEYLSSGTWITTGAFTTTNLGADTAASVTSTATFTFPSSGTWTFRIYYEAYDTNGTVFGSVSYNYASGTATAAGPAAVQNYQIGTYSTSLTLSGYTVPAGYSVYNVDYSVDWYWSRNGTNGSVTVAGSTVKASSSTGTSGSGTRTYTSGSYSTTVSLSMQITATGIGLGGENLYAQISNAKAVVSSRQLITNTTTANNNFQFNSYAYTLTSAQVLATGSLNWVALGD